MGDEFLLHDKFKVTEQWMDECLSNFRLAENDKNTSSHKNQSSVTPLGMGFSMYLSRSEYILFLRKLNSVKSNRSTRDHKYIYYYFQPHNILTLVEMSQCRICLTFLLHRPSKFSS